MERPHQEPKDPKLPELRGGIPGEAAHARVLPAPLPYNDVILPP